MLTLTVKSETALDLYLRVVRIRRFEEGVQKLVTQGQLPGVVHLYIGEEAVAAGVCAALRDDNNGYGEFTPQAKATSVTNIADRAPGYSLPGVIVDGTDPVAVYEVAATAVERARRGGGPTLIEAKTHRRGGHAEGENAFLGGQTYRSAEEVASARTKDPVVSIQSYILTHRLATAETLARLDGQITSAVADAILFARTSADPGASTVLEDVWA